MPFKNVSEPRQQSNRRRVINVFKKYDKIKLNYFRDLKLKNFKYENNKFKVGEILRFKYLEFKTKNSHNLINKTTGYNSMQIFFEFS